MRRNIHIGLIIFLGKIMITAGLGTNSSLPQTSCIIAFDSWIFLMSKIFWVWIWLVNHQAETRCLRSSYWASRDFVVFLFCGEVFGLLVFAQFGTFWLKCVLGAFSEQIIR
jgi:hypothetical protein